MIEVIEPGPLTLVEDLGRVGHAALGVSRSGAADRGSLRLANRLVGNPEDAAAFEVTLGGLVVRFHAAATFAVTGAPCALLVDRVAAAMNGPVTVPAGATLKLGAPVRGLRSYLAVRGGLDVPSVLGSRSTDLLSGLGPPPVAAGEEFPVGTAAVSAIVVDHAPVAGTPSSSTLEVLPTAALHRYFPGDEVDALALTEYVVTADSNRVALRLHGRPLQRIDGMEAPPQGLVPGAIQAPPNGQPVVFLADHPVTGGYPVVGVLTPSSLAAAAQTRPGESLRLRWCGSRAANAKPQTRP
jgi:biotin-dependent carboxylase-like uncharacterized protein